MKPQLFIHREGKTYFRRGHSGPVYQVNIDIQNKLCDETISLRKKMFILVGSFLTVFVFTIFLLPQILNLNFEMALIVVTFLLIFSFVPFFLLVKFNLGHQRKIRTILAEAEAVMLPRAAQQSDNTTKGQDPRIGVNTNRLVAMFLLGVVITTVGIVMLFSSGDLPFKKQLIWWMNVFTGSMLTGLGFYGLLRKKPQNPNQPNTSDDDPGDLP